MAVTDRRSVRPYALDARLVVTCPAHTEPGGFLSSQRNVFLGTTSRPPTTSRPKLSTHEPKANQGGVLLRA
eukprot:173554-Prymnesium_polylepis.1